MADLLQRLQEQDPAFVEKLIKLRETNPEALQKIRQEAGVPNADLLDKIKAYTDEGPAPNVLATDVQEAPASLSDALSGRGPAIVDMPTAEIKPSSSAVASSSSGGVGMPNMAGLDAIQAKREAMVAARNPEQEAEKARQLHDTMRKASLEAAKKDPSYTGAMKNLEGVDAQIANTRQLMRDDANSTQWMSALERIGQALTQFAAAKYGAEKGVNLAGLKMDRTDWEKMLANSQDRLQNEIRDLQALRKEHKGDLNKVEDEALQGAMLGVKTQLGAEEDKRRAEERLLNEAEGIEKFKIQENLATQRANMANAYRETSKMDKKDAKVVATLQALEKKDQDLELKKLDQQEKALQLARAAAANLKAVAGKPKEIQKVTLQLNKNLSNAGIDPQLVSELTGWFTKRETANPEKVAAELEQTAKGIGARRQSLTQYREGLAKASSADQIDQIRSARLGQPADAPAQSTSPVSSGMIKVRNKATGQEGSMPADRAKDAIQSGKYEQVK